MALANLQGSEKDAFPWIAHAPWNGLTVADLVCPMFLLAVGLSLPLAQDGRVPRVGVGRIARRAVLLWLIGFGISLIVHPSTYREDMRFTGVLQRIGIVYLACALTVRSTKTWKPPAIFAIALLVMHGALLLLAAPGELTASMESGQGMSGWLDHAILGGTRMYGGNFDPEGPLGTLSSIATAMIGVAVQRLAMRAEQPMAIWIASSITAAALGLLAWALCDQQGFVDAELRAGQRRDRARSAGRAKAEWPRIGTWDAGSADRDARQRGADALCRADFVTIVLIRKFGAWTLEGKSMARSRGRGCRSIGRRCSTRRWWADCRS